MCEEIGGQLEEIGSLFLPGGTQGWNFGCPDLGVNTFTCQAI